MGTYSSFEDLRVWQDSMDLTAQIYKATQVPFRNRKLTD
jgi:hypothetical protein